MTSLTRSTRNVSDLQREIDRVFGRFFPSRSRDENGTSSQPVWAPRMDLIETDNAYRIHLDVPGIDKDDLKINYQDNQLTVSGERPSPQSGNNEEFVRVERSFGSFYRSFSLPKTVNADRIQATYEHGVLTISVPKAEEVKPRQIEIQ